MINLLCRNKIITKFNLFFTKKSSGTGNFRKNHFGSQMASKCLVALDFDHTIIDDNSDTYVCRLAPDGKIPQCIKDLYRSDGWTMYMRQIFKFLHEQGVGPAEITKCMTEIPFCQGMKELLQHFGDNSEKFEVIIISDSNSIFIDQILRAGGVVDCVNSVYSNPAQFSCKGLLEIEMYHEQDWCKLSTVNMCKGHILVSHIENRSKEDQKFDRICYIGDGKNDLCPSLRLNEGDTVFARKGYTLDQTIRKNETLEEFQMKAKTFLWTTGFEIKEHLEKKSA